MTKKDKLIVAIAKAEQILDAARAELHEFDCLPENNTFDDLDTAAGTIEDKLLNFATQDCEGSHNRGNDEYSQEFIVNGVRYVGTLKVEYNRRDKQYYYVDESDFDYKLIA